MRTYSPNILENLNSPRENYDIPIPAAILLSSPLVTAEQTSESWSLFHKKDVVSQGLAKLILKEYLDLPRVNIEDLPVMRLHHVRKDFDRFLPKNVMVFVGDKECLRDDVLEFVKVVEEDGKTNIKLYKEHYAHDWFMIHQIMKRKDKKKIAQYDELFVDFAVRAVNEAKAALLLPSHIIYNKDNFPLEEKIVHDSESIASIANETIPSDILEETDMDTKYNAPFDLLEKIKIPVNRHKPNTILSEYAIITDHSTPKGVTV